MTLLPRPSRQRQVWLTQVLRLLLVGIVVYGLVARQPKAIVNGTIALWITSLPATVERNYRVPLDPWLGLWVTAAVALHAVGSAGVYSHLPWWDHVTHALSASVVAAVGYTAMRGVELHSDEVQFPREFVFVFILLFVLAFGVLWELFEFGLDGLAAATGWQMPLAQHGLADTVIDLIYNALGAILVALFGQAHLSRLAEQVRARLAAGP